MLSVCLFWRVYIPDFRTSFSYFIGLLGRFCGRGGSALPVAVPLPAKVNITQKDVDTGPCLDWDLSTRSQCSSGQDRRLRRHGRCYLLEILYFDSKWRNLLQFAWNDKTVTKTDLRLRCSFPDLWICNILNVALHWITSLRILEYQVWMSTPRMAV
jgi:hypothetical protein